MRSPSVFSILVFNTSGTRFLSAFRIWSCMSDLMDWSFVFIIRAFSFTVIRFSLSLTWSSFSGFNNNAKSSCPVSFRQWTKLSNAFGPRCLIFRYISRLLDLLSRFFYDDRTWELNKLKNKYDIVTVENFVIHTLCLI